MCLQRYTLTLIFIFIVQLIIRQTDCYIVDPDFSSHNSSGFESGWRDNDTAYSRSFGIREEDLGVIPNCGLARLPLNQRPPEKSGRIVHGVDADEGEFPYFAVILSHSPRSRGLSPFCGASILSAGVLLTAAHCVKDESLEHLWESKQVWFRAGTTDWRDERRSVTVGLRRVVPHPKFSFDHFMYDVAVVFLDQELDLRPGNHGGKFKLNSLCLPEPDEELAGPFTVIGFGATRLEKSAKSGAYRPAGGAAEHLQEVTVDNLGGVWCVKRHKEEQRSGSASGWSCDPDSQIFAIGGGGRDSCSGDSGGPLIFFRGLRAVHAGIVSWGETHCGKTGSAGVYTKVSHYVDWIRRQIILDATGGDFRLGLDDDDNE